MPYAIEYYQTYLDSTETGVQETPSDKERARQMDLEVRLEHAEHR